MFVKLLGTEQSKKEMEQKYKAQIKDLQDQLAVANLERTTISSREEMTSMEMMKHKEKAEMLEQEMSEYKKESDKKEKERRQSFTALQNSYWTQLLQVEDESTDQIRKLKVEIVRLRNVENEKERTIEWLTTSKRNLVVECAQQMNDLRRAVQIYNKTQNGSWF